MADPKTPRAAALRNQVDLALQDVSAMSAEELMDLGVEVTLLPPGPRPEPQRVRSTHPLNDGSGRVLPARRAE